MPFRTHEKQGLIWLTSESLALPGVRHGFSTRPGGVSLPPWDSLDLGIGRGDNMDHVRENYRRFCTVIGTDPRRTVLSRQVHEDNVLLVTENDIGKGLWRERDYTSADALICRTPNIALTVFSADCGIILLYDPVRRAIGAVHAGWRGVAMCLVQKTALEMQRHFGTDPHDLRCAIGPAIGPCCFETDDDVPEAIEKYLGGDTEGLFDRRADGKTMVDLRAANARRLVQLGLKAENIDISDECTFCSHDKYWSHRYTKGNRGSQAAVIVLD